MEKKRRSRIVIFQFFGKDKVLGKWRRNFLLHSSALLLCFFSLSFFFSKFQSISLCYLVRLPRFNFFCHFLHWLAIFSVCISPFFILAHLCLLMTCVSLAAFLYIFGNGRKPWFLHTLSFSVLTKHWLFMTANSLMFSASIQVFLSVSHFHGFSTSCLSETSLFFSVFLPLSLLGTAPAVCEQIA